MQVVSAPMSTPTAIGPRAYIDTCPSPAGSIGYNIFWSQLWYNNQLPQNWQANFNFSSLTNSGQAKGIQSAFVDNSQSPFDVALTDCSGASFIVRAGHQAIFPVQYNSMAEMSLIPANIDPDMVWIICQNDPSIGLAGNQPTPGVSIETTVTFYNYLQPPSTWRAGRRRIPLALPPTGSQVTTSICSPSTLLRTAKAAAPFGPRTNLVAGSPIKRLAVGGGNDTICMPLYDEGEYSDQFYEWMPSIGSWTQVYGCYIPVNLPPGTAYAIKEITAINLEFSGTAMNPGDFVPLVDVTTMTMESGGTLNPVLTFSPAFLPTVNGTNGGSFTYQPAKCDMWLGTANYGAIPGDQMQTVLAVQIRDMGTGANQPAEMAINVSTRGILVPQTTYSNQ